MKDSRPPRRGAAPALALSHRLSLSPSPSPSGPASLGEALLRRIEDVSPERALQVAVEEIARRLGASAAGVLVAGTPFGPAWNGRRPEAGRHVQVPLEPGMHLAAVWPGFPPPDAEPQLLGAVPLVRLALRAAGSMLPLESEAQERGPDGPFPEIQGKSPAMRKLFDQMLQVADFELPVCILGESGTGKELVARCLHARGPRAGRPFVPVHCGALPDSLVEAELFGHLRGSFTGAVSDRKGLLEEAHGGTLLLDEVGELPLAAQVKLLRFLQDGELRRIGERRPRRLDARVLAATHRDLEAEVREGRFREDLFYRLHVVALRVPALRERGEDVLLLADHLLEQACRAAHRGPRRLSTEAQALLLSHAWPGNVRELDNAVRAALAASGDATVVHGRHLPARLREAPAEENLRSAVEGIERRKIAEALEREAGCRARAARRLGVSRQTLHNKMRKYDLV